MMLLSLLCSGKDSGLFYRTFCGEPSSPRREALTTVAVEHLKCGSGLGGTDVCLLFNFKEFNFQRVANGYRVRQHA